MTGYLVLTCGEASFARSGPLEMMRAGVAGSARASRRGEQGEQREQRTRLLSSTYRPVVSWKRPARGLW